MKFATQRELLEYAGKCPNDRSLVQRWRSKGKVYMEDGMYVLVEDDVDSLRRENEELKQKLKEKSEWSNSEELANYKKWLDQANNAYEELERGKDEELDWALRRCFDYMQSRRCLPVPTFNEFKKWCAGIDTSNTDSDFSDLPF